MWISTNRAFLSVVQPDPKDPKGSGCLLVRARVKGHIEAVFPSAEVFRVPGRDYLYRAYIDRAVVAVEIAHQVTAIDYPNFKNSVDDDRLHTAYAGVWSVMAKLQAVPPYGQDSVAARKREGVVLAHPPTDPKLKAAVRSLLAD